MCLNWIARNTGKVSALGDVPDELLYKVGCLCGAKDLQRLEDNNPGREGVFEVLWAALLKRDFHMDDNPWNSRQRYREEEEKRKQCLHQARAKLQQRYELATLEKKQHRVAKVATSRNTAQSLSTAGGKRCSRKQKMGTAHCWMVQKKTTSQLQKLKMEARHQLYSRVVPCRMVSHCRNKSVG
ncbi:hypothetical protein GpartN1_g617.t1 [Galdieria partita]|uniref:Uncharacterized protein n=1 Tax=Galdieria partita TaxID=83374 RepID=A0A9C7PR29_9RHOD|nr:hypothetical protein GpartN1_g617.t1 [Galdieria partita]